MIFTDGPSFTCDDRYEVRENEIVHCEADGKPKPNVSWFVGEKVEGGKEVAALTRWTKNDRGIYSLLAINKHGSASHRLRVDVLCTFHTFGYYLLHCWHKGFGIISFLLFFDCHPSLRRRPGLH